MTMDPLTTEAEDSKYDLLIEGTGLPQSILAAAVSRLGRKVIHIDRNTFYGSYWSSLSIHQIDDFVNKYSSKDSFPYHSATLTRHPISSLTTPSKLQSSRSYALNLFPGLLYCSSDLVQCLANTRLSTYLEFKALEHIAMMQRKSQTQETDGPQEEVTLEKVPSSREDVFTSSLTLQEKRKLMKFLNYCLNTSGTDEGESQTLEELLSRSEYSLPSSLRNIIQYAIALSSTPSIPLSPAFHAIKRHLSGFGVYGAFPIIVPLYGGGGELCQAFCRNAAVKGGTYILGRGIRECLRTEEGEGGGYKVIFDVEEGEEMSFVYCKNVVREMITGGVEGDIRDGERGKEGAETTRSIVIVEGVLEGLFEEGSTFTDAAFIVIPPGTLRNEQTMPIQIILHSGGIGECPPGQWIIYSSIQASGESAHEDLSLAEKLIINHVSGDNVEILLRCEYTYCVGVGPERDEDGVRYVNPPGTGKDYDEAYKETRRLFVDIFGEDEEFLVPDETDEINPEEE